MRRISKVIFIMAVAMSLCAAAFGNAGPTFWPGKPSSTMMLVEMDSPIAVKSEELVFDLSQFDRTSHTLEGKVTATYDMANQSDTAKNVQMAFPFVECVSGLTPDDIIVLADGDEVPYEIFIGDVTDNRGDPRQQTKEPGFDFVDIVEGITGDTYVAKNFDIKDTGILYSFKVEPKGEDTIHFAVSFPMDYEKTKVIIEGFNRYERSGEEVRIASWCETPIELEIFVLGNDIDFEINAYADVKLKEETESYICDIVKEEIQFVTYLTDIVSDDKTVTKEIYSASQLYNMYAQGLDNYMELSKGFISHGDIRQQAHYERILTVVYDVEFLPQDEKELSVHYKTSGTMDRSKTVNPIYSFEYFLNPAVHWKGFENLHISVMTPQEAPYIVDSSINFDIAEDNIYTASLLTLPEGDLAFSLYDKEEITPMDRLKGKFHGRFNYLTPFALYGLLAVVVLNIAAAILNSIRKRSQGK